MAIDELKSRTVGMLGKAVERVLADEKRAAKVAKAVGAVQRGRQALVKAQESFSKAVGFPSKRDYKDVSKRISALRRRIKHVAEKVEKID